MSEWDNFRRPVTAGEIALAFGLNPKRLKRLIRRRSIAPAVRIGRLDLYGPKQVQRIYDLTAPAEPAALATAEA